MNGNFALGGASHRTDEALAPVEDNPQRQEEAWIARCREGETQAFCFLVERYERMVRAVIRRLIATEHDVDDLAQQSFVSAYEKLAQFNGSCQFSTWLCQIALNKARDAMRTRRYRQDDLDVYELELEGDDDGPQARLEAQQEEQQLDRQLQVALGNLKPEERELIVLKYIQGYGYDTVADMLGCTVQAAKVRSFRAREKLKEILQRFGVEL